MNRLFGMFHAKTPQRSKDNIVQSLQDPNGVVRVVFASVAMGMGVDLQTSSYTMELLAALRIIFK